MGYDWTMPKMPGTYLCNLQQVAGVAGRRGSDLTAEAQLAYAAILMVIPDHHLEKGAAACAMLHTAKLAHPVTSDC